MLKKITYLLIIFFITSAFPQNLPSAEIQFQQALNFYSSLQYEEALQSFDNVINNYDLNDKTTAAWIFKGKILLKLERYEESRSVLTEFIEKYPNSNYLDEARLTIAKTFFDEKDYYNSLKELLFIISGSDRNNYVTYAKQVGESIAVNRLEISRLKTLYDINTNPSVKSFLLLALGKLYYKENRIENSQDAFRKIIENYPDSAENDEAEKLYGFIADAASVKDSGLIIAVLMPLSGSGLTDEMLTASNEILEGIKFSVSEFNKDRDDKIGLLIKDTEMSASKLRKIKNDFESIPSIRAIIGPVFSNEVRDALEIFKDSNIPIISPTATDNDLTSINSDFFQANPSFFMRGKVMAQYIYFVENKRKVAILNANDGYSPLLAKTFKDEFERIGGQVLAEETYKSKSYELSEPVSRLRGYFSSIDGLYIPLADKSDVPAILSQLSMFGYNLQIYGTQDWFLAKGYETSTALSNTLTFTSDYFIPYKDYEYKELNKEFMRLLGKDAGRNALYGYDTAQYLLTALRNGGNSRESIKFKMESGLTVNGFHNNISISEERVNRFMNIIRYKDGIFELVDKFKAGD